MRRPKWLSGWGKGKNPFEASLIIDVPDIKVVEASFNGKPVLLAVGTSQQPETASSGGGEKGLEWKIFYDRSILPAFIPKGKSMDFLAGTVAVSSGSASVYDAGTKYIASGDRPVKGNAPVLLNYEMARRIEEARKKK
jgi:hypothetical protein